MNEGNVGDYTCLFKRHRKGEKKLTGKTFARKNGS